MVIWPTCNAVSCAPKYEDFALKCGNFQNIFKHLQKNTILGNSKKNNTFKTGDLDLVHCQGQLWGWPWGATFSPLSTSRWRGAMQGRVKGLPCGTAGCFVGMGGLCGITWGFCLKNDGNTGIPKKHSLCQAEKSGSMRGPILRMAPILWQTHITCQAEKT